jgi:hypothetical protein
MDAQAHAAAEFGTSEFELLANNPKQRRILRRIYTDRITIHLKADSHLYSFGADTRLYPDIAACDPLVDQAGVSLANRTAKVLGRRPERPVNLTKYAVKTLEFPQTRCIVSVWLRVLPHRRELITDGKPRMALPWQAQPLSSTVAIGRRWKRRPRGCVRRSATSGSAPSPPMSARPRDARLSLSAFLSSFSNAEERRRATRRNLDRRRHEARLWRGGRQPYRRHRRATQAIHGRLDPLSATKRWRRSRRRLSSRTATWWM